MKTHELAKALYMLSKILKSTPNVDLEDMNFDFKNVKNKEKKYDPVGLASFVAFSSLKKPQWMELINEYELPIS
ncbi:MAG: hypothetical protein EOO43_25445, partial [Flavobacterium sp.]